MKVLVLSYFFAPASSPTAKRPFYFVKGFLDAGWQVDVISSYRLMSPGQPELLIHPRLNLQRIEDPMELIERRLSGRLGRTVMRGIRCLLWPDAFVLWALRVLRRVKFQDYDRVLVSVHPISSLVLLLNKKAAKRAVVDYQDSFSPNTVILGRAPLYRLLLPLLGRLQCKVLGQTGKTIFATESYLKEYLKHGLVESAKAVHIPFFYDDAAFKKTEPPADRFVISYMGQFGQKVRSPETFLQALNLFLSRNPQARTSTVFMFYGPWIEEHTGLVRSLGLQDVVNINPQVPYARYIELLSEAHVLLLVASKEQNFFVPSKMLDYFGAQRPILGFVPPDSETYSILKEAGMARYVSDELDVEGGARSLEQLRQAWRAGKNSMATSRTGEWSMSFQMPRILRFFSEKTEPTGQTAAA